MNYFNKENSVGNGRSMVRVNLAPDLREVIEVPKGTLARAIDSLVYNETRSVVYLDTYYNRVSNPIEAFGPFAWVELETGFEDEAGQKSVVCVAAKQ